jgi:hypothetical protein
LKKSDITKIDSIIDKVFANNNLYGKKLIVKEETLNTLRHSNTNTNNGTRTVTHMPVATSSTSRLHHLDDDSSRSRKQTANASSSNRDNSISKYSSDNFFVSNSESKSNLNDVYTLSPTYKNSPEFTVNEPTSKKGYIPSSTSRTHLVPSNESRSSRKQNSFPDNTNTNAINNLTYSSYNASLQSNDSRTNLNEIYSLATIYNTVESDRNQHQGRESRRDAPKTRTKLENSQPSTQALVIVKHYVGLIF